MIKRLTKPPVFLLLGSISIVLLITVYLNIYIIGDLIDYLIYIGLFTIPVVYCLVLYFVYKAKNNTTPNILTFIVLILSFITYFFVFFIFAFGTTSQQTTNPKYYKKILNKYDDIPLFFPDSLPNDATLKFVAEGFTDYCFSISIEYQIDEQEINNLNQKYHQNQVNSYNDSERSFNEDYIIYDFSNNEYTKLIAINKNTKRIFIHYSYLIM